MRNPPRNYSRLVWPVLLTLALLAVAATVIYLQAGRLAVRPVLLHGAIVTPTGVIPDGWLLLEGGKISSVSATKPSANAFEIDTGGLIFPGLIDLHNHVSYDALPAWQPPQLYADRYEWRADAGYLSQVAGPYDALVKVQHAFCNLNTYGEVRALAGGTTSILATADTDCIRGLVRNLDFASGLYSFPDADNRHILNEIELRATTAPATIAEVAAFAAEGQSEAIFIHLAEGVDAASLDEFAFLQAQRLLTGKTVLIHGVALGSAEFAAMQQAGAALVWSPRSNLALYGETTDVLAALAAGVPVALAPDWSVTGSRNLLDELRFAAEFNADALGGALTDEQLFQMATSIPAQMAGIDELVGTIQPGLYADLLVIAGDPAAPYQALLQAEPADVRLVLVGGVPVYGDAALMAGYWEASQTATVALGEITKSIRMPTSGPSFEDLQAKLQAALAAAGSSLAPLP